MIRIGLHISRSISRTSAKGLFFDRPKVIRAFDRATFRVFNQFGGFVRKTARRSIRKRVSGDPAPPGRPPYSRTGLLRSGIFYSADLRRRSVVIGPVPLGRSSSDAPEVLEHGGRTKRRIVEVLDRKTGKKRVRYSRKAKPKPVTYAPRPYMGPAFDKGQDRLDAFWREAKLK